jgi:hypothetical protein
LPLHQPSQAAFVVSFKGTANAYEALCFTSTAPTLSFHPFIKASIEAFLIILISKNFIFFIIQVFVAASCGLTLFPVARALFASAHGGQDQSHFRFTTTHQRQQQWNINHPIVHHARQGRST